jgi:hypothetical protein
LEPIENETTSESGNLGAHFGLKYDQFLIKSSIQVKYQPKNGSVDKAIDEIVILCIRTLLLSVEVGNAASFSSKSVRVRLIS